jgi:hypothetical protein
MRRGALVHWLCVFATMVLLASMPGTSRADDVTKDVYEDVKTVIEELITRDIADATVKNLSAVAPMRVYYRRSLQRIGSRYWGSLPAALKSDTIDLITDVVYWDLGRDHSSDAGRSPAAAIKDFFACFSNANGPDCGAVAHLVDTAKDDDFTVSAGRLIDACPPTGYLDVACSVAVATRSVLLGNLNEAKIHLVDLVGNAVLVGIWSQQKPNIVDPHRRKVYENIVLQLRRWLDPEDTTQKEFIATVDRIFGVDILDLPDALLGSVGKECDDKSDWSLFEGDVKQPQVLQRILCLAIRQKDVFKDVKLKGAKLVPSVGNPIDLKEMSWSSILGAAVAAAKADSNGVIHDDDIISAVACSVEDDVTAYYKCTGGRISSVTAAATINLTALKPALSLSIQLSPNAPAKLGGKPGDVPAVKTVARIYGRIDALTKDLRVFLDSYFLQGMAVDPAELLEFVPHLTLSAIRLKDFFRALRLQVNLWSGDNPDLLGLVTLAVDLSATAETGCKAVAAATAATPDENPVCRRLLSIQQLLSSKEGAAVRDVLDASFHGEFRDVAVRVLAAVFPKRKKGSGCGEESAIYGEFVVNFVSYVFDEVETESKPGAGKTVSREAFRASAVDMLRCFSSEGLEKRPFLGFDPIQLGLRLSWNQRYVNQAGSDGFRYAPSIDVAIFRFPFTRASTMYYTGLQASVFDPMSPLVELALHKVDATYDTEQSIWLNVITPRIDFVFGIPVLTSHVSLSAGMAYRLVTAQQQRDAADEVVPNAYVYSTRGEFSDHIELNVGVHYVF